MKYAGIGSRETPDGILSLMYLIGMLFSVKGITLCTGAAKGADQAFVKGAVKMGGNIELYLPWSSYEKDFVNSIECKVYVHDGNTNFDIVERLHPAGNRLKDSVKKLHARNVSIIEGCDLVVCWTKDGKATGGTGMGIRIANELDIPVFNIHNEQDVGSFQKWLEEFESEYCKRQHSV